VSTEQDKLKNSKRRHSDETAISKQVKIAKQKGLTEQDRDIKQPHRLAKHHAIDCGNPGCMLCGNPRKLFNELTPQEKRLFQDLEQQRDTHSNGLPHPKDQE
jgi:hypothetical protein